jgi:Putative viral replication protein
MIMPRQPQFVNWAFTLNNYTDEDVERLNLLGDRIKYLIAGKEVGETGTPHLQGFVQAASRVTMLQIKNILGSNPHVEPARQCDNAIEYCKKDGDYFEVGQFRRAGSRSDLEEFKNDVKNGMLSLKEIRENHSKVYAKYQRFCIEYIQDNYEKPILDLHQLREWQVELNTLLNREPDDRLINFVIDEVGNKGKSWFAHYYKSLHEKVQILIPGKKADMAYALDMQLRVLFIDAPRSKQGDFIQYDFLEEVKNGYVFSSKYESRFKQYGKVHVVVLMNELPDMTKLSQDRYNIIRLT